jgi:ABC-type polysaccharide/polyol phosphate export permease
MGLIFAGIIEIVDDIFVKDNFNSENVTYILSGLILQFIGLLVHDSIRGKVDESPAVVEE